MAAFSMGYKTNKNIVTKCGAAKEQSKNQDCCGNVEDLLPFSVRAYSFSTKGANDLTKEDITNRVRAFSVGSRSKTTRICTKTSPKLFNSNNIKNDFAESSTKKSISVPILVNKNIRIDEMGDLMEIDFSKPIDIPLKKDNQRNKNDCQTTTNVIPRNANNSTEYIHKEKKCVDNGYLEMKPITLTLNNMFNGNNFTNNGTMASTNDYKFLQKGKNHIIAVTTQNNIDLYSNDNKSKIMQYPSTSTNNSTSSSALCKQYSDDIKLLRESAPCINQDLYYASLDLPKCDNEVNTRYVFNESFSHTNIEDIKNEYAKIDFDQPEASCSFKRKK